MKAKAGFYTLANSFHYIRYMKTLTVQLPDSVDEKEAKTLLAAGLYEKGSISIGQAAELAGYSKRTFMEL